MCINGLCSYIAAQQTLLSTVSHFHHVHKYPVNVWLDTCSNETTILSFVSVNVEEENYKHLQISTLDLVSTFFLHL